MRPGAQDRLLHEIVGSRPVAGERWLENDEAMLNAGRPIPSGRIGRLVEILQVCDDELPVAPKL
jgi:hypothetical protein